MKLLQELKERKSRRLLCAALACGAFFAVGGQAEAASVYGGGTASETGKYQYMKADGTLAESEDSAAVVANQNGENQTYVSTDEKYAASTGSNFTVKSGEWGSIEGGWSNDANVTENTVTISGGTVNKRLYGGLSTNGDATGNTVTIIGSAVEGDIYVFGGKSVNGAATNNTVNLGGYFDADNKIVTDAAWRAIANTVYGGDGKTSTGNAVNVFSNGNRAQVIKTSSIQSLNFYVPAAGESGIVSNPMLTLTRGDADLSSTAINVDLGDTVKVFAKDYQLLKVVWVNAESAEEESGSLTVGTLNSPDQKAALINSNISIWASWSWRRMTLPLSSRLLQPASQILLPMPVW